MLSPNGSREYSSTLCVSKAELNLQSKGKAGQPDLIVELVLLHRTTTSRGSSILSYCVILALITIMTGGTSN